MPKKPKIKKEALNKRKEKPQGIGEKVINILKILNLIEQDRHPTVKELAQICEVSERSIYRYLYILNQVVPIVYDPKLGGYTFENPHALKSITVEKEELAVILTLNDMLKKSAPSLSEKLMSLMEKINPVGKKPHGQIHHYLPNIQTELDIEKFNIISEAALERMQLMIKYHSINTDEVTERLIDPYGLIFHDGLWFVYAYCHLRQDTRTFAIDRIIEIKQMKTKFNIPEGFTLREKLKQSWFIWEAEPVEVKVKFSKDVAELIKRKPKWHHSEQRTENPDGTITLTFTVSGTDEIKWWLYSWIPHFEIIEPVTLKETMKEELKKALERIN